MALYWPDEKVALDIIDDPMRHPFEGDDSYTVLRVTYADLCNYDSYHKIMERLCELLGKEMPSMPSWEDNSRALHDMLFGDDFSDGYGPLQTLSSLFEDPDYPDEVDDIEILATCQDEAEFMQAMAESNGKRVRDVSIWEGPVPPGSFEVLSDATRMSTPEYFFLRKSNQLPFAEAVSLGIELCGKYRTVLTQHSRTDGYDFLRNPRSSKATLNNYLREIRSTKEGKRAQRVLRYVTEECASPMSTYLYLLLCLPRNRGGYALGRALTSAAFCTDDGFIPSAEGDFMAYDLCWPKKLVALQYVGDKPISTKNYRALQTGDMKVFCVSDRDLADADRFDRIARKLAKRLGIEIPEPSKGWYAARDKLRRQIKMPTYDHMLLTMRDLERHKSW